MATNTAMTRATASAPRSGKLIASVFGKTIAQVRAITNKPVLLSETAVGPEAGRALKIPGLFAGMRQYKTLGLVWFDKDQNPSTTIYRQDWRLEGNQAAVAAFRVAESQALNTSGGT